MDLDDDILEIGCAIGFHTFPLADLAEDGEAYTVDISEDAIDYIKKKRREKDYQNITPICEDARELDLQNKEFDKIVCFDTLHDLDAPKKALNRWLKRLKNGGLFLYRDPEIDPDTILDSSTKKLSKIDEIEGVTVFEKE